MAKTAGKFSEAARAAKDFSNAVKAAVKSARRLQDVHNGNDYSDAGADPAPSYIVLDAEGNLDGQVFGVVDYLNVVNAAGQMVSFWTALPVAQGDYKSTLEKVADA